MDVLGPRRVNVNTIEVSPGNFMTVQSKHLEGRNFLFHFPRIFFLAFFLLRIFTSVLSEELFFAEQVRLIPLSHTK